ncbi:MAG: class I SAM-dependent methyltransferase, partial [Thermoanaerobaculia bacterium]
LMRCTKRFDPPGAKGYAENASSLIERYEAVGFEQKHQALLSLIPPQCSRALDVGAGAGGDAAWLAHQGYEVVAVEPTAELRTYASQRHSSPRIEWMDDCLPRLAQVSKRGEAFDLIILSAVWMHLHPRERSTAMPVLASLLSPKGLLYISLRHGPIPEGRVMFDVTPEETVVIARASGLDVVLNVPSASAQMANREAGVTWSQLAFVKDGSG